ncbi:DNA fragmentation factor subunit beta isoform X2 [Desmodus rotundus]|uniref:DNA fragmentation factor subunit beta isoform X2 n=1 Tax=Desmodus rotundus TaxID=9430 RepID=UPI002381599E|nr:DNA fragmentation factor subunit beta isoform X2 [Desmodus rotundus]
MISVFRKPKTFKLRALHSQQKFGVAGKSCQEVLRKGCIRFQLPVSGSRLCLYEDGTEVTGGYFWSVPDNSELVLLTEGQSWGGYVSDISRFLSVFHKPHVGVIQAARQLLSDERAPLRQKLLADLLHTISENIAAETRAEDPPWFEGLESRFRNKSSYLRFSCESRIRSYLREVSAHASVVGEPAREEFVRVVDAMGQKLRTARYNGCYFDRGAKAGSRLCTPEGWFSCQVHARCLGTSLLPWVGGHRCLSRGRALVSGEEDTPLGGLGPFDVASCASKHSINPYGNRESRVLFSTWNLDHVFQSDTGEVARRRCGGSGWLSDTSVWGQSPSVSRDSALRPLLSSPTGSSVVAKCGFLRSLFSSLFLIEKKRTVIPTLAEATEDRGGRQVDWEYFYSLLFTSDNLKLVHVACHKKTTHRLSCDPGRVYRPQTKPKRKRAARKCP